MFKKYDKGATMKELRDWLNENGIRNKLGKPLNFSSIQHTHALFVSQRYKKRLTTRSVELFMEKQFNKAGLGGMGYSPHKLRHTAATTLVKDGVDLLVIQKLLGHERPDTTEIYTQIDDTDIKKAVQKSSLSTLGKA